MGRGAFYVDDADKFPCKYLEVAQNYLGLIKEAITVDETEEGYYDSNFCQARTNNSCSFLIMYRLTAVPPPVFSS